MERKIVSCSQSQMPLTVACAVTIQKSQCGLSLPKITVDIGLKELPFGTTHVTFSTVRRLEDVLIKVLFAKGNLDQIRRMEAIAHKLAFEHNLRQLMSEALENEDSSVIIAK